MTPGTRVPASLLRLVTGSSAADAADRQVKNSASMRMQRIFSLRTFPEAICAKRATSQFKSGQRVRRWRLHTGGSVYPAYFPHPPGGFSSCFGRLAVRRDDRQRRLRGPLDRVTVERRRRHRERRAVGVPAREGENLVAVLVGEAGVR